MRRKHTLYVDKTRFLHELEEVRYAFFFRPRGFGKSAEPENLPSLLLSGSVREQGPWLAKYVVTLI